MTYLHPEHRGCGFTSDKILHVTAGVSRISSERYRCPFSDKDGVFESTGMAAGAYAANSKVRISIRTKPSLMKKADQLAQFRMNGRY